MSASLAATPTVPAPAKATARGVVVTLTRPGHGYASGHERATRQELGRRLAALQGFDFAGEYDPASRPAGPVYFVPSDAVVGVKAAAALGIRDERDLFGAVVPYPFVPTKVITHPLVQPRAQAPPGWSNEFADRVRDVVLTGFSVFSGEDARRAGSRLLDGAAALRVKPVRATGGRGQSVVADAAALQACLQGIDAAELACDGLVLEENLREVTTLSVGRVQVADLLATYHGYQRLTTDNEGAQVYGGSALTVVRGDFDVLLATDLPAPVRLAVTQACQFDRAAAQCFAGFMASRRNYDVAQGVDGDGRWRSGVLEQSWRVGGASSAEMAALQAFRSDPGLRSVRVSCVEAFGEHAVPPDAEVYFQGVDEQVGSLVKYARREPDGDA